MISIENLSFSYPGSEKPSLKDINLQVEKGECVVLAGPSGCGKSTLCLTLNGIIPQMIRGRMEGRVCVGGRNTMAHPIPELAQEVGLVFQNPDNQLFALTVEEDVAFGPENLGFSRQEMRTRVEYGLGRTGMEKFREKFVYNLSGGQKQRTAIAGILAMRPEILVFDEPTADLDPKGTREVLDTIRTLNREEGCTVLLVEHKVKEVLPICDRVLWMENGRIVSEHHPGGPLPEPFRRGYGREGEKPRGRVDRGAHAAGEIVIQDLSYWYPDRTCALDGVSLSIGKGELVALIGENGSGKSTLAMHLNGLLVPGRGTVMVCGIDTRKAGNGSLAAVVGYLFQNPDHQIFSETVHDEVSVGLKHRGIPPPLREQKVIEALSSVGLGGYLARDPNTLSRGERQRLAVATVLALEPRVLVFDEPTTGQDYAHIRDIMSYIERISQQGRTVLMITHDMDLAWSYADRVVVMEKGKVICDMPTTDKDTPVPEMFRYISADINTASARTEE